MLLSFTSSFFLQPPLLGGKREENPKKDRKMATQDEIFAKAEKVTPSETREGCFCLEPPVLLRCIRKPEGHGTIQEGELVHAHAIDEFGLYPGHIQSIGKEWWWPISAFELVSETEG